jgi:uncharacterized protein YjbJ (UPF0337 family)
MEQTEKTGDRTTMNQDTFAGQWKQMKGTLRSWWGKLTDDDWERINGQKDRLLGMLQEKYGYAKDMAQREIDRRFREYGQGMSTGTSGNQQEPYTSAGSQARQTFQSAQEAQQAASHTYEDMKSKAREMGTTASEKVHNATTTVGEKMSSLAGSLRTSAPQEGTMGSAAHTVADGLEAAGSYLQDKSLENMASDVTSLIRRYPIQSLLIGVGVGYLLSRSSER